MTAIIERTVTPTEEDKRLAAQAGELPESLITEPSGTRVQFLDANGAGNILLLPAPALRLLNDILKEMAKGNAVTLMPIHALLSTQAAADILNVSRPFLIGLLDAGKIPYRRLGSHRRIRFQDVMDFKAKTDAAREDALRTLTEEAQELDMGY